ncbi:hypothetical protein FQN51_004770 [Onygenales sp. PD_10]|nr:hypothetical protein FQN51_004770 [Onygenales sp. PD_10]
MVDLQWIQESFSWPKKPIQTHTQNQNNQGTNHGTALPSSPAEYLSALESLQTQERALAYDAAAIANATQTERDAAAIFDAMRAKERERSSSSGHGDHFLANVDRIDDGSSDLMRVARALPKGAHLHCHFNTVLHPSFLVRRARDVRCMYVRSSCSLAGDGFKEAAITFSVLREADVLAVGVGDVFEKDYTPYAWMRYSDFLQRFPGGLEKGEEWLVGKMVLAVEDVHAVNQTLEGVWDLFNRSTQMMKGLFNYESAFRAYIGAAIDSFVADNIMYAEVRPNFFDKYIVSDDGETRLDHHAWLRIIGEETAAKIRQLDAEGEKGRFVGMKVIYCAPRSIRHEDMEWCLNDCIELKQAFPDLICGFDMVGCESRGHPLRHFHAQLLAFQSRCTALNLPIPFLFHAGETLDSRSPTDSNLYDAILLRTKRIGHGYALAHHPLLMQRCRELRIAVEICPISNEILHLCASVAAGAHVLPTLLANNVPCALSSDNPAYFRSSLGHDFYAVAVGMGVVGLLGCKVLVEWGIEHSCMEAEERAGVRRVWEGRWRGFCEWVVREFGGVYL